MSVVWGMSEVSARMFCENDVMWYDENVNLSPLKNLSVNWHHMNTRNHQESANRILRLLHKNKMAASSSSSVCSSKIFIN
ncbi:hypothetical protein TNCT_716281 [Trichonephila clavata]|uniref:Uncharacterized protein n=1 Tax=Trichonephila clavata TaxID=2740835 RepID=A0A8X6H0X0_TRICU|nr:hypothetical protein TNCT_716281 [Trichonephila clavata]